MPPPLSYTKSNFLPTKMFIKLLKANNLRSVGGREECVYSGLGFGKGWDEFVWHESSSDF